MRGVALLALLLLAETTGFVPASSLRRARRAWRPRESHDPYQNVDAEDSDVIERISEYLERKARDPRNQEVLDHFLRRLPLEGDCAVLEVGSGTGQLLRRLSKTAGVGRVVGIDRSAMLVEKGKKIAEEEGVAVEQLVGDALALPFEDESFDVVLFCTTLMHLPVAEPRLQALREAARVCKAGGYVGVFDNDAPSWLFHLDEGDPLELPVSLYETSWRRQDHTARDIPYMLDMAGLNDEAVPLTVVLGPSTGDAAARGYLKRCIRFARDKKKAISGEIAEALEESVVSRFGDGEMQPNVRRSYVFTAARVPQQQ